jgi:hypothetical protein
MRLDFTRIQPILDSILPFSSCKGTKGATDKEMFKIQSKPTRRFTIPKPHHSSIQAVEDPPARPTAIKITQTIRPTNRATTRTIFQQTKPTRPWRFPRWLGLPRASWRCPSRRSPAVTKFSKMARTPSSFLALPVTEFSFSSVWI